MSVARWLVVASLCLGWASAWAAPLKASAVQDGEVWRYEARWVDGGQARVAAAELPGAAVQADLRAARVFPMAAATAAQVKAVRTWAETLPAGTTVRAQGRGVRGLSFSASGPSRAAMRDALRGAERVAQTELERFARREGFVVDGKGLIVPDHVREARSSVGAVRGLAAALAKGVPDEQPRAFADRALGFVQAIPYERRGAAGDAGFRRPLSLLVRNKGDCDGKSVLFLALMRARFPKVPLVLVLVPGHALVGIGLEPRAGETTVGHEGARYVLVEAVGPAQSAIGEVAPASRRGVRGGKARVEVVPAGG